MQPSGSKMDSNETDSPLQTNPYGIPAKYKIWEVVGEGCFGKVVRCLDKETKETVAIKIPKHLDNSSKKEVAMLKRFRDLNLDKLNIVEFIDSWQSPSGDVVVLEALDICLDDYIKRRRQMPMLLSDIRNIIQQLATALDALKGIGVIHTDLKLQNIMMENHRMRPFKVKLIDFGLAIPTSKARQGMHLQPLSLRSPEIILGCPFSEAIDMWSLGCVMTKMICGHLPFSGGSEFDLLRAYIDVLGQPADCFYNDGRMTKVFCTRTDSNTWRLKTNLEYRGFKLNKLHRSRKFQTLDDLKTMREEEKNKDEAVEREQCIELLKAMLTIDPDERITPSEVLTHPFITRDYPSSLVSFSEWSSVEVSASSTDESVNYSPPPTILPSGVIMVKAAPPENTQLLDDQPLIREDPTACHIGTKKKRKKKEKKKNIFRRTISLMREEVQLLCWLC
ncbi:homeodomain-interacting protein kinase 2-like isoform X2 [Sparus aurata]|uniref:homeodomain-interacting protein kinase 2-like isoform X2 n=1 Tax=Sparus aurata TaxID=8175 RepID=UPI0011C100F6|nr:homeodomain-interacting protein kinase 2-like isoform X2 [Sparus aurata]